MALSALAKLGASFGGAALGGALAKGNLEEMMKALQPRDVFTPLGSVRFDDGSARFEPSRELATISRTALQEAAVPTEEFAARRFGALSALAQPREQELLDQAREKVFQSGRLGTVGGLRELRDVREAMMRAATARAIQSEDIAFNRQGALVQRGISSILQPFQAQAGVGMQSVSPMMNLASSGLSSLNQFMPRAATAAGVALGEQLPGIMSKIGDIFSPRRRTGEIL